MDIVHTSVLLQESLQYLAPDENSDSQQFMIDTTLGEGGHSEAFLKTFPSLNIMGLDADEKIQARAKERLANFGNRMQFHLGWSDEFFKNYPTDLPRPNIILSDLGISLFHYVKSGRGFTFRNDEPLDMRLNPNSEKSAASIVNSLDEENLANLIFEYGEERYSRRISKAIVEARQSSKILTSGNLADIIYRAVPSNYRHGTIHPATKTFQALRIAVNGELDRLPRLLENAFSVLSVNGKMGIITFHSLEDRIVKNFFRDRAKVCTCPPEQAICNCGGKTGELITRKPIEPSESEIKTNSPSRSAKLRVIRKIKEYP